jgi:uncharacterized protein YecE (DUF72 family)
LKPAIHIGTSGWHYKHWCGPYYEQKLPASKMLACYYKDFDTVEINNSFYKLPNESTFAKWREDTPKNFCFAVKGSRFITHMKKLKEPEHALNNLIPRAGALREKLGPILFQLPPHWPVNLERLETFLNALPPKHLYAFEFREPSWHREEVYALLRAHNAAFCIFELDRFFSPEAITADWTYIRLHGPGGKYRGSYSTRQLREWAAKIRDWSSELRAIYLYFDNDQAGYAVQNALELKSLVATALSRPAKPSRRAA